MVKIKKTGPHWRGGLLSQPGQTQQVWVSTGRVQGHKLPLSPHPTAGTGMREATLEKETTQERESHLKDSVMVMGHTVSPNVASIFL